jgi:hypothetical protein
MGTRHLICVVSNGEYKVAQYGQWDGYPTGQGIAICDFIQNEMNIRKFRKAVNECKYLTPEELKDKWIEFGVPRDADFVDSDIADKFAKKYPQLSRDAGAKVLKLIQNGTRELQNSIDFAGDSLFCEWAYVLNLDNKTLEVYNGFNTKPLNTSERFHKMSSKKSYSGSEYFPIKSVATYSFKKATKESMCELEKSCSEDEDDE